MQVPIKKIDCYFWLPTENMFYHVPHHAISHVEMHRQAAGDRGYGYQLEAIVIGVRIPNKEVYDSLRKVIDLPDFINGNLNCLIACTRDETTEVLIKHLVLKLPIEVRQPDGTLRNEVRLNFLSNEQPVDINTIYGFVR